MARLPMQAAAYMPWLAHLCKGLGTMVKNVETRLGMEEYGRQTALHRQQRTTLARDLFMVSILFLVASGAGLYHDYPLVAAALFVVFLVVQQVASETRLEIAMVDANRLLVVMVDQQAREIEQLRDALKRDQYARSR